MTTSPQAPPPGLTVGGYALRARLGEGGMGVVHLGQKPGERPVAIKVLRPHVVGDDEARRRLAREVGSLTRVRSRRIAEIVDADPWGEIPYVATRYVPGLSLHDHVQEEGALEGDDLLWFADCLAEALDAVHAVGVLHRDIKPSNVIMEGRTPILIDFGLARVADDSRITMNGWLLGTPGYLAPEILHGEDATAASDVHAWAATVAYAGTGRAPFGRGPSVAIMDRVRRGEHDLTGLDPMLRDLVEEALAPAAADRPSLDEVRDWIDALASVDHVPGQPLTARAARTTAAPVTLPYVAVAQQALHAPTEVEAQPVTGAGLLEEPFHEPVHWSSDWASETQDLHDDRFVEDRFVDDRFGEDGATTVPHRQTRVLPDGSTEWVSPEYGAPARENVPAGERLRRGVSLLALGGVVAGGVAFAPYLTLAVVFIAVWLLRSGSLAAASAGSRRQRRGAKWYDGVQLLLAAPWHVVAGLGGTLLLLMWSLGIGAAIALLCFAASVSMVTSLGLVGAFFALGLWWGPGSERLRSPIRRVADPLARRGVPWLLVTLLVAATGTGLGAAASAQGTDWAPYENAPFSDVRLPGWL
ncbi:putative Ser/Thr protein kinase [Nocardioides cavernae]|uniref:Putative Ser/Thr protein kinase n=1 Tax=Nocardioides cavernae TaxID=1921566 RepID=A0A7Y9GZ89_9ACTN|nr:serine/threonine-protein kinase [Nocardioides cavernae]NYE35018.1 putative Ser/Thr protein kinase [Nocardioides cavernae]